MQVLMDGGVRKSFLVTIDLPSDGCHTWKLFWYRYGLVGLAREDILERYDSSW
jgi:hypothetical protein